MKREREMQAPKLRGGVKTKSAKRTRYWSTHEAPARKITKLQDLQRNARRDEASLFQIVADLGERSDVAVMTMKPSDLQHNRAFAEHQQKLRGALSRLKKIDPFRPTPKRAALAAMKSAFKALDVHYEPCGKRSKKNKCHLSDGHIGACREE